MHRFMVMTGFVHLLFLLWVRAMPARAADAEPASSLPPFRERYSKQEYDNQVKIKMATLKIADRQKLALPPAGMLIKKLEADSYAAQLGLRVNDIIFRSNGHWVWPNCPLSPSPQEEHTVDYMRDAKPATVKMKPGRLGITESQMFWLPELTYLRIGKRDPKWDDHVMVGIITRETDPALAETAWAHAIAAGYKPDYLSALSGIEIALRSNRPEDALKLAAIARLADPNQGQLVHPHLLYRAALANGDLKMMAQLLREEPHLYPTASASAIEALQVSTGNWKALEREKTPSAIFQTAKTADLLPELANEQDENTVAALKHFRDGNRVNLKAETGHYQRINAHVGKEVRGAEFHLSFRTKPMDQNKSTFRKEFMIALVDQDWREKRGKDPDYQEAILTFRLSEHKEVIVKHSCAASELVYLDNAAAVNGSRPHNVNIIVANGVGEIQYNGARIVLAPIPDHVKKLSIIFGSTGMNSQVGEFTVRELVK